MERLAADPMASVPKACQGWGETMAAYRFFDNENVSRRGVSSATGSSRSTFEPNRRSTRG